MVLINLFDSALSNFITTPLDPKLHATLCSLVVDVGAMNLHSNALKRSSTPIPWYNIDTFEFIEAKNRKHSKSNLPIFAYNECRFL